MFLVVPLVLVCCPGGGFPKRTVGEGTKSNGLWGTIEFFTRMLIRVHHKPYLRLWCIQADEECHYNNDVKGHTTV